MDKRIRKSGKFYTKTMFLTFFSYETEILEYRFQKGTIYTFLYIHNGGDVAGLIPELIYAHFLYKIFENHENSIYAHT